MRYIYINQDRIVQEIIPDFVDAFPGVPVTERYSKAFLDKCLEVPDSVEVEGGMEYIPTENVFAPQIKYSGSQTKRFAPGEDLTLKVSFSQPGEWTFEAPGLDTEKTETGMLVKAVPAGDHEIQIHFEETGHSRTKDITINLFEKTEEESK